MSHFTNIFNFKSDIILYFKRCLSVLIAMKESGLVSEMIDLNLGKCSRIIQNARSKGHMFNEIDVRDISLVHSLLLSIHNCKYLTEQIVTGEHHANANLLPLLIKKQYLVKECTNVRKRVRIQINTSDNRTIKATSYNMNKKNSMKLDIRDIGGMIHRSETPIEAAMREIREELGVNVNPSDLIFVKENRNFIFFQTLFDDFKLEQMIDSFTSEDIDPEITQVFICT